MSHGGGDDSIEPDLTPLLDLVMQLLMFFIVNVRFITEQVSQEITLPESVSARPVTRADADSLFINQKMNRNNKFTNRLSKRDAERLRGAESVILVPGKEVMSPLEAKTWLKDLFQDAEKVVGQGNVKTIIHFRPDGDLELNELFKMMNFVKAAGYKQLKIRAIVKSG
jgi:biopolymer transport protein ExbD